MVKDLDYRYHPKVLISLIKGIILCRKLPCQIRKTGRGWHYIWRGLPISEEQSYIYRKILYDDAKRVQLDRSLGKRRKQTQILFFRKDIKIYNKGKVIYKTTRNNNTLKNILKAQEKNLDT